LIMNEHYVVTVDQGHLRIFAERQKPGQFVPGLEQVEALDFPLGRNQYTDRETDKAGRFGGSKEPSAASGSPNARNGMSIDERLPMQREEARRRAKELAAQIDAFFQSRPEVSWDFAAGPALNGAVLELISPAVRSRVRRSVAKDLVHHPVAELRAHFASS